MKQIADKTPYIPFKAGTTILLVILVLVLALVPMVLRQGAEFGGADGQAEVAITEISPDYVPWFQPLWEPPSGEIESLFFSSQAAIGAGIIGYALGLWKGRKEKADGKK